MKWNRAAHPWVISRMRTESTPPRVGVERSRRRREGPHPRGRVAQLANHHTEVPFCFLIGFGRDASLPWDPPILPWTVAGGGQEPCGAKQRYCCVWNAAGVRRSRRATDCSDMAAASIGSLLLGAAERNQWQRVPNLLLLPPR